MKIGKYRRNDLGKNSLGAKRLVFNVSLSLDKLNTVTLIREINLILRNQLSLAKSTYKIKILWQMYILIALFTSKKVTGLMGGNLSKNNKF